MFSTVFQVIGMVTVGLFAGLLILAAMGLVVLCVGHDEEDDISIFGFAWGWSSEDD